MPVVLNVNDNPGARYLASKMLRACGFEVVEAESGRRAIDLAKSRNPDAVLLDLHLPDLDGLEVTRALKADESTRSIAVVITSAYAAEAPKVADAYLPQPYERETLAGVISSLLSR
jgi:CheY-like chemotaxis protein